VELTVGEELEDYLRSLGEIVCRVLGVLPSNEFSFTVRVDEGCLLEFTVAKRS
jgi:hypothetical protein